MNRPSVGILPVAGPLTVDHPDIARARLAAIVESSDDAIVSKNLDGIVESWNRAAEQMFGFTSDEAIGRHISLIIPEERLAEEDTVISRIRRGEKVDHFETERQAKDGHRVAVSLTVSPVVDSSGRVVGASKVARDISERIRNEAERERLLEAAESARADAETANRTKDEFLAVLSHELRAPMNAMLGWLRILKTSRGREPAMIDRAVDTLERNVRVQAQVINDLLDVSRILSGKLSLDIDRLDLNTLVSGCVDSLRPSAEGKSVSLRLESQGGIEIDGDPARIQQIVANLIGNAIKFTDAGGTIAVRVTRSDTTANLTISDTGAGIAPEFLPHLFERFRQAESGSARKHGGLGLGLSIVTHLVALHHGHILAESAGVGHGAVFSVTFPIARGGDGKATPRGHARYQAGDIDILLVDDDDDTRGALEIALREHGLSVRSAATVREALREYHSHRPDIVISDVGMPGEDGYALVRAIRDAEEGHNRRTLAVAVTGFAGRADVDMALRAGFDEHVAKPIEPDLLVERLRVLAAVRDPRA